MDIGGDMLFDAAAGMGAQDFMMMDHGAAFGMMDAMGFDAVKDLGGEQMAGMFGAMEGDMFAQMGGEFMADALGTMGIDTALDFMPPEAMVDMFGAMDPANMAELRAGAMFEAAAGLPPAEMAMMPPEAALGMFETMGTEKVFDMPPDAMAGMVGACLL